jgi:transcriptional regulator with XRE-family HTH domain
MQYTISDNIRLIREAKGYSQEYVSKKLKVTQQAYSMMEKKPENMTLARLKSLAHVLDVSLMSLICEDNAYIQHNFNQQGGQAATQMVFHTEKDNASQVYEKYIHQLKDEITFLRSILASPKKSTK